MESNPREITDSKAEFRKPSNDGANRKYRRRSPADDSSSSDGSPQHKHGSSPVPSRKDTSKFTDYKRKHDDDRDQDYSRNKPGRSGELYKHSDHHSSRSYHRPGDGYDRGYSKSSYHSGRHSREGHFSDYSRGDKELRSRDSRENGDKFFKEKSDGSGHRSRKQEDRDWDREDRTDRYRGADHRSSYDSRKDSSGYRSKEASSKYAREVDDEKYVNNETKRQDDRGKDKEPLNEVPEEHTADRKVFSSEEKGSLSKKPKLFVDSASTEADVTSEQAGVKDSDIDAAKIAAMKAAELVNKNLVGTGFMSADQKKKLLWGNKKTTASEESTHRWDTTTFGDPECQEKFNKLMSLRLPWYLWPIVGREGRRHDEYGAKIRQCRCGEAKRAASGGVREAIHCWVASKGWSNCWSWSVKHYSTFFSFYVSVFYGITLYSVRKIFCKELIFNLNVIYCSVTVTENPDSMTILLIIW